MKRMKNIERALLVFVVSGCLACSNTSDSGLYQHKRDNISSVESVIKEIEIEDVLIGSTVRLYLVDKYLLIADHKSTDKLIHVLEKDNFRYVTSIADIGQGPGEIAVIGHIEEDKNNHAFWVSDHGKQRIFRYDIDSALAAPTYMPTEKIRIENALFPHVYNLLSDSISIGLFIKPIRTNDFTQSVAKWNMRTGEIETLGQEHPEIRKKRVSFAVSNKHGLFVECYAYEDLMTIYTLDGKLQSEIYGPGWGNRTSSRTPYYRKVAICGDYIFATYAGENHSQEDHIPTKFIVFDTSGHYIKTVETEHKIADFCYDEANDRIILNLDSEIQFAYLDLDELI